ncbi:efflux RND transporter periplasmic adaptor subunit [Thiohalorhabdus sp.]|uniref:efflux RND transporter periplasmic adaptor subunit n=1 Tax=Thiohalorhabdus sp. TaxID=3094134 RepID=UPI002FC2D31F
MASNDAPNETASQPGRGPGWKTTVASAGGIALAGAAAVLLIFRTEPMATKGGATKETAMLVAVTRAEAGTFRPTFDATGTVRAAREIVLRPRVAGKVQALAADFVPGGVLTKGETAVRLDPADYRNALAQRESELAQAEAELKLEMGRQDVAAQEYDLLDEDLTVANRALVLRKPQLRSARSRVESARAAVKQARLELARTRIKAPFDAHVLSRDINMGSQVAAGDRLARLVGADTYWVEATVPLAKLRWLTFREDEAAGEGSRVRVRNRGAWAPDAHRTGRLFRLIGTLEEETRMARVLVAVDDPLAQTAANADKPSLMLDSYVQTRIRGRPLADVVRLDRDYLRQDRTVWVMREGKLAIREVAIALLDRDHAYITGGLGAGEKVVVSDLATVKDGAPLRRRGSQDGPDDGTPSR